MAASEIKPNRRFPQASQTEISSKAITERPTMQKIADKMIIDLGKEGILYDQRDALTKAAH